MVFERDDPSHVLDLEGASVLLIEVVRGDKKEDVFLVCKEVDLLLGALGHEDADDGPGRPVKEAGSQHVERPQSLGVVVVQNRHELLHALLRYIIRLSHFPPIIDHTQLVGL